MPSFDDSNKHKIIKGPNKRKGEKGPNPYGRQQLKLTLDRKEDFCEKLAEKGIIQLAADHIGIAHRALTAARSKDPLFAAMWEDALSRYRAKITEEMHRRAVDGTPRQKFYRDQYLCTEKEYSDTLLIKLLDRHCPEFRAKIEARNVNVEVDAKEADLEQLTPAQVEALRVFVETLTQQPPTDTPQ